MKNACMHAHIATLAATPEGEEKFPLLYRVGGSLVVGGRLHLTNLAPDA